MALESGMLPALAGDMLAREVLSKKAVEQRIACALRGLSLPERSPA